MPDTTVSLRGAAAAAALDEFFRVRRPTKVELPLGGVLASSPPSLPSVAALRSAEKSTGSELSCAGGVTDGDFCCSAAFGTGISLKGGH